MKRYSFYAMLMLAIAAMLVAGGCTKDSPNSPDEAMDQIDLENGGFSISDETPDEFLIEDFDVEDPTAEDAISSDPAMTALLDSNGLDIYHVRITWGLLEWDSTNAVVTDWNGSAVTNKGTMLVQRVIRFERATDRILKPRPDRKTVEWESKTVTHMDGIHLVIIDNDTSEANVSGALTINVGPYSNTFTFEELDSLDLIEDVDNIGNQVAVQAYNKKVIPFAGGFLEGRWIQDKRHGGRFWGRWMHSTGLRAGFIKGIWGINRFDQKVMYGKYISLNGRFKGLLRGGWEFTDEENGLGEFHGNWVNAAFSQLGTFKGKFKTAQEGERKGFFRGMWKNKK